VLLTAARHADVVGLSGLGRTLADGHHHEARWSLTGLRRQLELVREAARQAGRDPVIEALVQVVTVTGDRDAAIRDISSRLPGASADDIAHTPFVLAGSHQAMAGQLRAQAGEFGITRYVVREPAVPDLERVMQLL
jgi:alkanesulfonate monooxygenase SsuD/methylene tetrahydromethanopterin reductase-like flavin-dependent oxidoreductase (luciferase family)